VVSEKSVNGRPGPETSTPSLISLEAKNRHNVPARCKNHLVFPVVEIKDAFITTVSLSSGMGERKGKLLGTNELPMQCYYCTKEYSYLNRVINISKWKGEHCARCIIPTFPYSLSLIILLAHPSHLPKPSHCDSQRDGVNTRRKSARGPQHAFGVGGDFVFQCTSQQNLKAPALSFIS